MYIEITEFFNNGDHWHNSNSVANLGHNAGSITWNNAKLESNEFMFVTEENKEEFQSYFKNFGAWPIEEIKAWDNIELNALLLQLISGDIIELEMFQDDKGQIDWQDVEEANEQGQIGCNLFKTEDNQFYYYIGS